ncbi:UMP kinase [Candidatus Micrarchaeota archaeon]|nr:UMP kinase [Candidatus Micrarchaeota archaeon]
MKIVLSIGGSSINPKGEPDLDFLKKMAHLIKESKNEFGLVSGGGSTARAYANAARTLGASEYEADNVGIVSTRQNAQLLVAALKGAGVDVSKTVFTDFDQAKLVTNKVVVMGGTIPGITTDTDAVLLAEAIGAKRLVNISNVSGIYNRDPRKNKNAKKFDKMTYDQLISLAAKNDGRTAGTHFVFDMLACKLIARSNIETHFVDGRNMHDIKNSIEGKKHSGTVVGK